jgi:hypothetical protein
VHKTVTIRHPHAKSFSNAWLQWNPQECSLNNPQGESVRNHQCFATHAQAHSQVRLEVTGCFGCSPNVSDDLAPMCKLVLECIALHPVSARGLQSLLQSTLAAAEVCGEKSSSDQTQQTSSKTLEAYAFAALVQLNTQRLVSNFDDSSQGARSRRRSCFGQSTVT